MSKIKVLHIIKSLGRGGAEMLLPETLKIHDKEQFEFHYIYFLPWKDQMVEAIEVAGGNVNCFKANDNIRLIGQYRKIQKYCKSHHIDLIHCHLPWAGFVGRLVHSNTKIPVVYTEHNLQERYHRVTKTLNKLTFNSQTVALGVSEDVTRSIQNNISPNIPVNTLLNGVNTKNFRRTGDNSIREELGIPENAIVVGNVAVFRFQKRIVEWLHVLKKLNADNPNIYGIIVGAGPLEEKIKQEWEELELQDTVFFAGLQTEVRPYFEAMDIFMMSSSFEGLPIALLEAMSMECAIVSTNAGGIKEVIRNKKDGLLCDKDNYMELAPLVLEMIKEEYLLKKYKVASRARVLESFSLTNMVSELEKTYQNMLAEK